MGIPLQLGTGKVNALYQIKKCFFFSFRLFSSILTGLP